MVNLGFTSFRLSVGAIQSANGLFIVLMTPLIIAYWKRQELAGREPSAVIKMAIGFVILSISYFVLAGAQWAAGGGEVLWIWPIVYTIIYTAGELYFSPVGLSLYAKAAPPQVAALMMAVFLATSFPGNYLAGWLGKFYSEMGNTEFFLLIAVIALAPAPIIWAFDRPLKAIMRAHEDNKPVLEKAPYQAPPA